MVKRIDYPFPTLTAGGTHTNRLLVRYFRENSDTPSVRTFNIKGRLAPNTRVRARDLIVLDYRVDRETTEILLHIYNPARVALATFGAIIDFYVSPFAGNFLHDLTFMTELWTHPNMDEPFISSFEETTYSINDRLFIY
jgi:hypothetical protein